MEYGYFICLNVMVSSWLYGHGKRRGHSHICLFEIPRGDHDPQLHSRLDKQMFNFTKRDSIRSSQAYRNVQIKNVQNKLLEESCRVRLKINKNQRTNSRNNNTRYLIIPAIIISDVIPFHSRITTRDSFGHMYWGSLWHSSHPASQPPVISVSPVSLL